jgi:hypothetical protein
MVAAFVFEGREISQRRLSAAVVVEAFDEEKDRHARLAHRPKSIWSISSNSSVAKNLSRIASSQASPRALQLLDLKFEMRDLRVGPRSGAAALVALGFRRQPRRLLRLNHRGRGGEIGGKRFGAVWHV